MYRLALSQSHLRKEVTKLYNRNRLSKRKGMAICTHFNRDLDLHMIKGLDVSIALIWNIFLLELEISVGPSETRAMASASLGFTANGDFSKAPYCTVFHPQLPIQGTGHGDALLTFSVYTWCPLSIKNPRWDSNPQPSP